jgi:hypothetical protein
MKQFRGPKAIHWHNWYAVLQGQLQDAISDNNVLAIRVCAVFWITFKHLGDSARHQAQASSFGERLVNRVFGSITARP